MLRLISPVIFCLLAIANFTHQAEAQQDNPVYVDDSPQAWELFQQAEDQAPNNAGEAVRLYQELLDEFALKLVPVSEAADDHLMSVRRRVNAVLRHDQDLLERYRLIQTAEAERLLQEGDLARLARTRALTEPGLEAMLRLAQRDLESARFERSLACLGQALDHPEFVGRRAAHGQYMIGVAGHYLGRSALLAEARTALAELGNDGEAFSAQIERVIAPNDRPELVQQLTVLEHGGAADLSDLVPQAIWWMPLKDSLLQRRFANARNETEQGNMALEQRLREADLSTAAATVAGEVVYINQGHTVHALNRLTGRELWPAPYADINRLALSEREGIEALDMNIVAVSGNRVVTLTGHAQAHQRSDGGKVTCLDAGTGSPLWSANLNGLVESTAGEELFAHGAPLIHEGLVFVAARKVAAHQLLTSAYVVAIELESGRVRWVQHIASSGGLRVAPRPFCSVVYFEGALYAATAVGAAARLDAATGEIQWLRRFNVPISPAIVDQGRRPWEMTAPVVTSRGVVTMQPDQRRVVLLDRETGDVLEDHPATSPAEWNTPKYLLADRDHIFAVGSEIRAFRLDDLEHPAWRLPAATKSLEGEMQPAEPLELRGRVQLAGTTLIVPTATGVQLVDCETGNVDQRLPIQPTGNPLAVESQLLIATGDRLDAYMSFTKAERMLRDRLAAAPDEPEPALSLLRLGMRVRNLALSLEAADLATRAIDRRAAAAPNELRSASNRAELFSLLLELAQARVAANQQEGEALFATLGAAAQQSEQRVEYQLAYGDWLTNHALPRAVEAYQTILSDQMLARTPRIDAGTMRPAAAWATERLADLIQQRGPTVYAPQDDFAALRLQGMLAGTGAPEPQPLLDLALEFPFASAALDASLRAADVHLQRGGVRAALAALITVHLAAPRAESASRLLARAAEIAQEQGWIVYARDLLEHVLAAWGDQQMSAGARSIRASDWLAAIDATVPALAPQLPRVGDPRGEALPVKGNLIPIYDHRGLQQPADRALLREGDQVHMIGAEPLKPVWTATIGQQLPQILRFDQRGILLWLSADAQDPKALMLNFADGALRWTTPALQELLGDPVRDLGRARGIRDQMPNGEPFDPMQTLPLVNGQSLILVQRTGGVVAFDLADGRTVRWSNAHALDQVHAALLHDSALVLAGMARSGADESRRGADLAPRLLMLDPLTGESLFDEEIAVRGRAGVKWMSTTPLGQLAYGTAEGIDLIDLHSGQRRWTTSAYATLETRRAWRMSDRLIVEDAGNRLRSVNLGDGVVSAPFEPPVRGEWDPMELKDLIPLGDRVVAHYRQRVVMYDAASGELEGADVISDERDYRWLLPAIDRMLLVNGRAEQVLVPDQSGRRTQYVYRIYALSDNGKVLEEPLQLAALGDRLQNARLIEGWLLLSTQTDTLAVPMPVE